MNLIQINDVKNILSKTNLIRFNDRRTIEKIEDDGVYFYDSGNKRDLNKDVTILILSEEDLSKEFLNIKGVTFDIVLIPKSFKDTWLKTPVAQQIKPCIAYENYSISYY